jgi:hypothetical protein
MIADRLGVQADVIETYEKLFFDVRHRLEAVGYILHVLIGPPIRFGFSLDDLGSLWKFYSYMGGPHALDVLLHVFPGGKPRPWPSTLPATPAERITLIAACKRMVLTRCLRPANMSPADISRLLFLSEWFQDIQEAESVNLSGIGPIVEVDVTSLLEPRNEDLNSVTAACYGSPGSTVRSGCVGAGGGGNSDGNNQAEVGFTCLDQLGDPVELINRVTA